ncbi:ATP-binding protein [Allosphingosinicella indica]|uniref:histidine kinase n=1 Tax=Allosphingosinicella indica TaxID=941907 RepID=A0A1X7G966_9SPHN|nr:ATP-binding protein [Allosphingosinicella indica]SMF66127.1 His Kinase A (phospho-acceptor) domain-containing protein [Allosphingosinicella indica]
MTTPEAIDARWRRVPLLATLLALFLFLAGVVIILLSANANQAQRARETGVQAEMMAASVVAALDFGDAEAAQDSMNAARANPQVVYAATYDGGGQLVASFVRGGGRLPANLSAAPSEDGLRIAQAPVLRGGDRIGTVRIAVAREPLSRRAARFALIGIFVVMAALIAAVLGAATAALRRANRMLTERADALTDSNAALQVEIEERGKAEEQLRQAQKMQALGQLTGGIAHDFNNLLTVIQGSADMLTRPGLAEDKRARFAGAIADAASRAAALTSQLLAFARRQPLSPEVIDLNRQLAGMVDMLDRALGERVEVRTALYPGACLVEADPAQLEAAVLNIAVNARDAMANGGVLTIATSPIDFDSCDAIALAISDDGSGIDPETLSRVFEPFFTTKDVGKGTGLGLSQVYGFATQSGGDIRIESREGEGTTVTLILPCSRAELAEAPRVAREPAQARPAGRILVVDDNEDVGAFAEALLSELGHRVIRARSGEEALAIFAKFPVDAVFTDVVMPGMSGLELADRLRSDNPGLPVVLTTGYSDRIAEAGAGGLPVVFKPYRLESLSAAISRALAGQGAA